MQFAVIAVAVLAVLVLIALAHQFLYVKVPEHKAASFVGRGRGEVVTAGGRWMIPFLETYRTIDLTPIQVQTALTDAETVNGVPVVMTIVASLAFTREPAALRRAFQHFQRAQEDPRESALLDQKLQELVGGTMRDVIATLTVEELHTDRDAVRARVTHNAAENLAKFGLELETLTFKEFDDKGGILRDMARTTSAESKRKADKAVAEAERDGAIHAAQAREEAAIAANKLALKQSELDAQANAARAQAEQAGKRAEQEALLAVEQQRALVAAQQQQAQTVAPAKAAAEVQVLQAEATRRATVEAAEAEAERIRIIAQAMLDQQKAEAEGKRVVNAALQAFTPQSAQLMLAPEALRATQAIASQLGQALANSHLTIVDTSSGGASANVANMLSMVTSTVLGQLRAQGIDLAALLNGTAATPQTPSQNGHADASVLLPTLAGSPESE